MSEHNEIEAFPGGIEVNEGSVPMFLKLVYVGFTIFGISYWFLYKAGDGAPLVQLLNAVTG